MGGIALYVVWQDENAPNRLPLHLLVQNVFLVGRLFNWSNTSNGQAPQTVPEDSASSFHSEIRTVHSDLPSELAQSQIPVPQPC